MKYSAKWPEYAEQWDRMTINPGRASDFDRDAKFAIEHRPQYEAIEKITGVIWYHIAIIHRRESDADFTKYLGNGQSLNKRTTIAPKGRGPFTGANAFVDGAVDALHVDGLDAVKDWRLEKILYYCELYNGFGYASRGLPSPYLWGGTNIQKRGKFGMTVNGVFIDNKFNSRAMDTQPGCAPLLATIAHLDPSVVLIRED